MRILYISHLHPPKDEPLENVGGMQNVSRQLLENLKNRDDAEVKSIIQRASWEGIVFSTFIFLFKLLFRIPRDVRKFNPDVILMSSMVTAGVIPFIPRFLIKTPVVTINHGQDVTLPVSLYQWYLPKVFKRLDAVISVSSATRDECIKRGLDPDKGVALPNGFDVKSTKELPEKNKARKFLSDQLGINLENRPILLSVGRQVKRKGHAWFIEEVVPKISHDFVFLAIGEGPETELLIELKERSKCKDQICLLGKQPDEVLDNAYAAADLFIMPNIPVPGDMEGFGIVLLEANRSGVPAVASDLEGIRDVIEQGVNGFKIPHNNSELFAEKINELLNSDLKSLSDSSKKYANETFSWDVVTEKYVNFLQSVALKGK